MFIPAWQIFSIPKTHLRPTELSNSVRRFRNLDTTIHIGERPRRLRHGQVVWGAELDTKLAVVAWDWREVQRNIIAISDPMAIYSNLVLVSEDDMPIRDSQHVLHFNRSIDMLPWQDEVCALWLEDKTAVEVA